MVFKNLCVSVLWAKVASALEGVREHIWRCLLLLLLFFFGGGGGGGGGITNRTRVYIIKCWFSGPVINHGTYDMTSEIEGVHICLFLKHLLQILHRFSLSCQKMR